MALVIADRVKETTTLTGTSNAINLGGAFTSFATFASKLSNADTTYYCIEDTSGGFEIGLGTYNSSSNNIARTTILKSSNSNNAVNWSSGSKTVFMTVPADKFFIKDANGNNSSIDAKAPLASPALTGNPTAPTQSASDNSTKIATTAYVDNQVATENTIAEMDDVTITSISDNEILQYNNSTSKFENQTLAEAGILTGNETITLSGDVSGSGTTSIAVTIADDSHNHTIANVDDLQTTLDAKANLAGGTFTGDVTITSTDDGATADPTLTLYRNSASPADSDDLGSIEFKGRNDNSEDVVYSQILSRINDASDGTEDGQTFLKVKENGNLTNRIQIAGNAKTTFSGKDVSLNQVDLVFEGSTADANETTLTVEDPTSDNTITLPDTDGTVLTTGNSDTPTTTTSSSDADFVLVDDGGTMKKITPTNLGIGSGATKGFATAMAIAL